MPKDQPFIAQTSAPRFGRGPRYMVQAAEPPARQISDDVKLFLLTFAGGFLFVWTYLA